MKEAENNMWLLHFHAVWLWEGKCEVNVECGWRSRISEKWVAVRPQPCTFSDTVVDKAEVTIGCGYCLDQGFQYYFHTVLHVTLTCDYEIMNCK